MKPVSPAASNRHSAFATLLAGIAVALSACVQARSPHFKEQPMPTSAPVSSASAPHTTVSDPNHAELHAVFDFDAATRVLQVNYRVRNLSTTSALAVFDRADLLTVELGQQALGDIAVPIQTRDGDDVTLSHLVAPLPVPSPESPPTPTALRVTAGATLSGGFKVGLSGAGSPRRIRWCLGTAAFETQRFSSPTQVADGELWRAAFSVVEHQRVICTPWYDVASAAFVG